MHLKPQTFPRVVIEDGGGEPLAFARDELAAYAGRLLGGVPAVEACRQLRIGIEAGDPALGEDGYRIRIGADAIRISGGSPRGALYGVYGFLKECCGCCFAAPGKNGEFVPRVHALRLPETEIVRKPRLWYRGLQFTERVPWPAMVAAVDWMAKNGLNTVMILPLGDGVGDDLTTFDPATGEVRGVGAKVYSTAEFRRHLLPHIRRRGLTVDMNHHNLLGIWLPPGRYFAAHPDWYPLIDGARRPNAPQVAICTSNRAAVDELIRNIRDYLRRNPEVGILGVVPQDGRGPGCQCAACARLDDPADLAPPAVSHRVPEGENRRLSHRYALLLNRVAEALADEFPKVRIVGSHYVDLQWPPRRVALHRHVLPMLAIYWRCGAHRLARGSACRMNDVFRELLEQWAAAKPRDFILYEYYMGMNAQASLPYPMARVIAEEWPDLIQLGVQGATIQSHPYNCRIYGLNYLVFAASAWADRADVAAVLDYWLKGMFGAAAPAIRPVFEALERAAARIAAGAEHPCLRAVPPAVGHLLPNARNIVYFIETLTPAWIEACVARARGLCADPREREQVEEFAAAVRYWIAAADWYRWQQRTWQPEFSGFTDADLGEVRACADRLEQAKQPLHGTGWLRPARPVTAPAALSVLRC